MENMETYFVSDKPYQADNEFKQYRARWFGLIILIFLNISNSLFWLGFAPIANIVQEYLNVGPTAVTMLATIFYLIYGITPGIVWGLDRWGIKNGLIFGAILNAFGGWIRYFAIFIDNKNAEYAILFIGQAIAGISNAVFLTIPTNYAMTWFSENSRATANTIGSASNAFGAAVASILIPAIVSKPDEVPRSLLICAVIATIVAIPSFFIPSKPPSYPSYSASQPIEPFGTGFKKLVKNRNFWILFASFTAAVGSFNAFTALINDIYKPYGYSEADAGIVEAIVIISGLFGAGVFGFILDKTHAYKTILRCISPLIGISFFLITFSVRENNLILIYILSACVGFLLFSLLPVALEIGVECTYPVSANTSASILWLGGNFAGVICTVVMDQLRYPENKGNPPENMHRSLLFQGILVLFFTLFTATFYNAPNLRHEDELRIKLKDASVVKVKKSKDSLDLE